MGVEETGSRRPHFIVAEKNSGAGAGDRWDCNGEDVCFYSSPAYFFSLLFKKYVFDMRNLLAKNILDSVDF